MGDDPIFEASERGEQFTNRTITICMSARTRLASSALKGSSLPTVSRTGMREVSGLSFRRWQTSNPPYPGMYTSEEFK